MVAPARAAATRRERPPPAATRTGTVLSLVDAHRAAIDLGAVHLLARSLATSVIRESHEPESAALASIAIEDDLGFLHCTALLERGAQRIIRGLPGQTAYEDLSTHVISSLLALSLTFHRIPAGTSTRANSSKPTTPNRVGDRWLALQDDRSLQRERWRFAEGIDGP
jgi:hypothetical protein